LLIIGKGTVPIAAWELTTGVENIEEHGGTAEMSRATNGSQAGTQTSGCIVTVGVNGITGMKTVGGAKANSRQVIDSGDLPPKRIINLRILGAEHPRAEEWDTYYRYVGPQQQPRPKGKAAATAPNWQPSLRSLDPSQPASTGPKVSISVRKVSQPKSGD